MYGSSPYDPLKHEGSPLPRMPGGSNGEMPPWLPINGIHHTAFPIHSHISAAARSGAVRRSTLLFVRLF